MDNTKKVKKKRNASFYIVLFAGLFFFGVPIIGMFTVMAIDKTKPIITEEVVVLRLESDHDLNKRNSNKRKSDTVYVHVETKDKTEKSFIISNSTIPKLVRLQMSEVGARGDLTYQGSQIKDFKLHK